MSMFKQCLKREEAKESHIWHKMNPLQISLIHHRMPKFPWPIFLHPRSSYKNVIKTLIQAIPGTIKRKEPRCITRFQCPTESYSRYWSKIMGFSSFPQGLEDLHIQKDTMSMSYVKTMEELEGIPWRITRPLKTRFNPRSTQIRSNSKNLSAIIVDAKFCSGYCIYFHFGPWAHLWRILNLDLEPCPFFYFIESLSRFELVISCPFRI